MRELLPFVIALHGSWSSHTPIEVVSTTESFFLSNNSFLSQADDYGRDLELDYDTVSRLASLPFHCYTVCILSFVQISWKHERYVKVAEDS